MRLVDCLELMDFVIHTYNQTQAVIWPVWSLLLLHFLPIRPRLLASNVSRVKYDSERAFLQVIFYALLHHQ